MYFPATLWECRKYLGVSGLDDTGPAGPSPASDSEHGPVIQTWDHSTLRQRQLFWSDVCTTDQDTECLTVTMTTELCGKKEARKSEQLLLLWHLRYRTTMNQWIYYQHSRERRQLNKLNKKRHLSKDDLFIGSSFCNQWESAELFSVKEWVDDRFIWILSFLQSRRSKHDYYHCRLMF